MTEGFSLTFWATSFCESFNSRRASWMACQIVLTLMATLNGGDTKTNSPCLQRVQSWEVEQLHSLGLVWLCAGDRSLSVLVNTWCSFSLTAPRTLMSFVSPSSKFLVGCDYSTRSASLNWTWSMSKNLWISWGLTARNWTISMESRQWQATYRSSPSPSLWP